MSIRKLYTPAEYHQMVAALMKEKEWQQKVIDLATVLGYQCYHTFDSRRSTSGYPDLTICKQGRLIFAELKAGRNKPTVAQDTWLKMLATCPGVETYVWKPVDIDTVIEILQRSA